MLAASPKSVARWPGRQPVCPTDAERPIFLLASGMRCGSTLLQRLLNSHPEVLVWGESGGTVVSMLDEWEALSAWERRFRRHRTTYLEAGDSFMANMCPEPEDIRRAAAASLHRLWATPALDVGRPRWGFKEVRCDALAAARLVGLFPRALVVHLTRDPVDVLISLLRWDGWTPGSRVFRPSERTLNGVGLWVAINRSFAALGTAPSWLVQVRYERLVADPAATLAEICGRADLDPAGINLGLMDRRLHGSGPSTGDVPVDRRPRVTRADLTEAQRAMVSTPEYQHVAAEYGYRIRFDND